VRAVGIVLATICSAALGAWLLAWNNCVNILPGRREFDYFCGHNAPLQLVPLFVLLLVLLIFVFGAIARRWKARRSSEARSDLKEVDRGT
jgi:hypothetical protein